MMDMFKACIEVLVSEMHIYLQIREVVYMKQAQLFVCQSYLNSVV